MSKYLKQFENHSQYEQYIGGGEAILPNVSYCVSENEVHMTPYVEPTPVTTQFIARYNVEDLGYGSNLLVIRKPYLLEEVDSIILDNIEIDMSEVDYQITTDELGEHGLIITLNEDTTEVESFDFSYCTSLTSITIPNSVTSIGDSAFLNCSGLTSITMPNSVTNIGHDAFAGCVGLTSITIPNSVTNIGELAFGGCDGLTSCTIGSGVTSIVDEAFHHCISLDSITCLATTPPPSLPRRYWRMV